MELDDSIFGDLEDQCTCWVCFEMFKEPVTLNCSHTFCKECALKVHKKNPICPFCRKGFDLPLPDVNKDLIEIVNSYLRRKEQKDTEMNQVTIEQDSYLLHLPKDMVLEILSHLPPKQVGRTSKVCRDLRTYADDSWIWRDFCRSDFPFCSVDKYGKNWKWCYISRSNIHKGWEGGKAGDFEVVTLRGHKNYVNCFRLYRNNIVSGSADTTLKIWKADSNEPLNTLVGHNGVVQSIQFNEVRIVSGSADNSVKVWDTKTGLPITTMHHAGPVNCANFNDNIIVSGSDDTTVKVWDIRGGNCRSTMTNHSQSVKSLEFDNNRIVSCGNDSVKVVDIRNGNLIRDFNPQFGQPSCFQTVGNQVVVGHLDGDIRSWDINNGTGQSFTQRTYSPACALQSDGKVVVTAHADGVVRVWDLNSRNLKYSLKDHTGPVHTVQLSENKLVTGGADNCMKVWDLKKGTRMYTLLGGSLQQRGNNPPHPSKPGCSYLEIDDSRIVASFSSLIRVYDFEVFKPMK